VALAGAVMKTITNAATIIDAGEGQHIIDQVVGALSSIKDKKE